MKDKFQKLMQAVDEDLLEEAIAPVKKQNFLPWLGAAVAACALLMLGLQLFPGNQNVANLYNIKLPENAEHIRYEALSAPDREGAQVSFVIQDTTYVYQVVETPEPTQLTAQENDSQLLAWNAGQLDLQLLACPTQTWVSWYLPEEQTQWYLSANADSQEVLTTANEIFRITGLNVTVAPESAENITYDAFLLDGLTVAETTFRIDGTTYTYRMAATTQLQEDFADISGLPDFPKTGATTVLWCNAKFSFQTARQGKIIWFDVVPGILYSLSMDRMASLDALEQMAQQLFEPTQENS